MPSVRMVLLTMVARRLCFLHQLRKPQIGRIAGDWKGRLLHALESLRRQVRVVGSVSQVLGGAI